MPSFETSRTTHPSKKRHILGFKVFEALRDAGFRREVAENCALLGCYTESSGKSLPTFRSNLSAPSLSPYRGFGTTLRSRLRVRTDVSGQHTGPFFKSLPTFWDNLSVLSSSPYRRFGTTYRSFLQVLTDVLGQPTGTFFKSLPTFWDNLSVLSSSPYRRFGTTYPFGKEIPLLGE